MTHLERLFAALYISEKWYVHFVERTDMPAGRRLYARCRGVVLFDRVLNDEVISENERAKAFRSSVRAEPMNQGSWI